MGANSEMRKLLRAAKASGCRIERARTGHIKVHAPSGGFTVLATTPSDRRGFLNARSRLRRLGVDI